MFSRISVSLFKILKAKSRRVPKIRRIYGDSNFGIFSQDTEKSWGDTENRSLLWGENFGTSGEGAPKVRGATPSIEDYCGAKVSVPPVRAHRKFVERHRKSQPTRGRRFRYPLMFMNSARVACSIATGRHQTFRSWLGFFTGCLVAQRSVKVCLKME